MNKIKYLRRLISKLSSFAVFGIGSLILFTTLFPVLHILSGFSEERFQRLTRKFIHKSFIVFVHFMQITGSIRMTVENKELLKGLHSKVVIANHPSLLDVVLLISLIPNADCIVKGALINNKFMSGIIRNLYIPNTLPFEKQLEVAAESMKKGNNLIIFPEGTRSTPGEPWFFKKGAARFALFKGNDVLPIYFGGNEKIGLRKKDKMLSFHPTERYLYNLKVLPTISVTEYKDTPMSKSAIALTDKMREILSTERANDSIALRDNPIF